MAPRDAQIYNLLEALYKVERERDAARAALGETIALIVAATAAGVFDVRRGIKAQIDGWRRALGEA